MFILIVNETWVISCGHTLNTIGTVNNYQVIFELGKNNFIEWLLLILLENNSLQIVMSSQINRMVTRPLILSQETMKSPAHCIYKTNITFLHL